MKFFFLVVLGLAWGAWGLETAVTQSGRKVILKNDGTWEWFDASRHLEATDVRAPGAQVQISLKYKDRTWCLKERRMELEAGDVPETSILDSLRKVPAGGILVVQAPQTSVSPQDPRTLLYWIRDQKGKVLLQREISEKLAVPADEVNLLNLASFELPAFQGDLQVEIQDKITQQTFEYTLSAEKP